MVSQKRQPQIRTPLARGGELHSSDWLSLVLTFLRFLAQVAVTSESSRSFALQGFALNDRYFADIFNLYSQHPFSHRCSIVLKARAVPSICSLHFVQGRVPHQSMA
jgi:hypothetical protein